MARKIIPLALAVLLASGTASVVSAADTKVVPAGKFTSYRVNGPGRCFTQVIHGPLRIYGTQQAYGIKWAGRVIVTKTGKTFPYFYPEDSKAVAVQKARAKMARPLGC